LAPKIDFLFQNIFFTCNSTEQTFAPPPPAGGGKEC
jgi:hypothetical protein